MHTCTPWGSWSHNCAIGTAATRAPGVLLPACGGRPASKPGAQLHEQQQHQTVHGAETESEYWRHKHRARAYGIIGYLATDIDRARRLRISISPVPQVNISYMSVSRTARDGEAIMAIGIDSEPSAATMEAITKVPGVVECTLFKEDFAE